MLQFTDQIDPPKIITLLSKSLPYYLESWRELDDGKGLFGNLEPTSFNMRSVGSSSPVIEYVLRPHINILCVLSAYLYLNKTDVISPLIDRSELIDKLKKGLAWACGCHITGDADVEQFLGRRRWGENWRSSVWASLLGAVAVLAESVLSEEEQLRVRDIIAHEADRFSGTLPPSGCQTDSKAEENAQDAAVIAWAINLCPHHPHALEWEESLTVRAVNIASSVHDSADHEEYSGSSVARTVTTCNLFPDLTAESHGFFHPDALSYGIWLGMAIAAYKFQRREPPPCLLRNSHRRTFDILVRFCLPNGMFFAPGGHDMPLFTPHPLALAWGLWNGDPRAAHMTAKLLTWMDSCLAQNMDGRTPWIPGFGRTLDGWELQFQSRAGAELALLACLPFPKDQRAFSAGQVENAVDTRHIYPHIEVCYRRNVRSTRSMAWKAIGGHPMIGLSLHVRPELLASFKAALLGMPSIDDQVKNSEVLFHSDRYQRDGFDTWGRIAYYGASGRRVLTRDLRVLTWGEEGLVVLDQITANVDLQLKEQYLSPLYIVNDHWTSGNIEIRGGALKETVNCQHRKYKEIVCPAYWATIENELLYQFLWKRDKGLCYLPGGERNAPPYWKNCRLDILAVHVDESSAAAGDTVYTTGFYIGGGKGPRMFKTAGTPGEFFKGLVVMDGKITIGLD